MHVHDWNFFDANDGFGVVLLGHIGTEVLVVHCLAEGSEERSALSLHDD